MSYMAERVVGTGSFGVVYQVLEICKVSAIYEIGVCLKVLHLFGPTTIFLKYYYRIF